MIKLMIAVSFLLAGCGKDIIPDRPAPTVNETADVSFLFETEGCKVYRFTDSGRYHYFTNCTEVVETRRERRGKTSVNVEENNKTSHALRGNK